MRNLAAAACLAMLAACGPPQERTPQAADSAEAPLVGACTARTSLDWAPVAGGPSYRIAATAAGSACDAGIATLTVTDGAGATLYTGQHQIEPMTSTVFAESKTPQKLEAALADWIDPQGATQMRTTAALPDWPAGAEGPDAGEFPFYPEEGMSRDLWLRLRAQDKPLYCFVQGGESMLCLALDAAANMLTPVGVQTFPG